MVVSNYRRDDYRRDDYRRDDGIKRSSSFSRYREEYGGGDHDEMDEIQTNNKTCLIKFILMTLIIVIIISIIVIIVYNKENFTASIKPIVN